jgi:hypothetical protein
MDPAKTLDALRTSGSNCTIRFTNGQVQVTLNDQNRSFTTWGDAYAWIEHQAQPQTAGAGSASTS